MPIEISCCGNTYGPGSLRRGMLFVAQQAARAGVVHRQNARPFKKHFDGVFSATLAKCQQGTALGLEAR